MISLKVRLQFWAIHPLAFALMGVATTVTSASEIDLTERVRREYPAAIAKLEAAYVNYDGTGEYTRLMRAGKKDEKLARLKLSIEKRGEKRLCHRTWTKENREGRICEEIRCSDPSQSAFTVVRYEEGGPLIVRDLGKEFASFDDHYGIYAKRHAEAAFSIFGASVRSLMADPTFKIRKASGTVRNGRESIRIDYDYAGKDLVSPSGWFEVSPQDGWVIQAYECQLPPKFKGKTILGEISYRRDEATGLGLPVRSVARAPDGIHTVAFDEFRVGPDLGAGHFTLAAFGIAEAGRPGAQTYESRPFYWFVVAAFVALSVAVVTKLALARMAKTQLSP